MNGQGSLGTGVEGQGRFARLPTEVLMMIISHFTPGALLAISRTSRFFRSLLFTKRAEPIWIQVRKSNGWLDSTIGDMNEIENAKFVDGDDCSQHLRRRQSPTPRLPVASCSLRNLLYQVTSTEGRHRDAAHAVAPQDLPLLLVRTKTLRRPCGTSVTGR
ncbi:hypothetical protein BJY59DRAFT_296883 [Rhodotorula toruloides]